jgi:solute carrier family 44 (choline transporter-like protein), member 2/4/5
MGVYGMAIDSILMCFLYDEEMQKSKGGGVPQHCPDLLKQFFDENTPNEKAKEE